MGVGSGVLVGSIVAVGCGEGATVAETVELSYSGGLSAGSPSLLEQAENKDKAANNRNAIRLRPIKNPSRSSPQMLDCMLSEKKSQIWCKALITRFFFWPDAKAV